jgi:hypothetical protein
MKNSAGSSPTRSGPSWPGSFVREQASVHLWSPLPFIAPMRRPLKALTKNGAIDLEHKAPPLYRADHVKIAEPTFTR